MSVMQTVSSPAAMRALSGEIAWAGGRVGLVPTMGALHDGHLSLVDIARRHCEAVVVSVFVNPTQFLPGEDYARYPRRIEADRDLLAAHGVAVLYAPDAAAMYGENASVSVDEGALSRGLCGPARPGHFRGVLTIVAKLFNDVRPEIAIFGQKDLQQARLIQQMAVDLHFPVRILVAPIVRESDGLAMSSRNEYLSPMERAQAVCLSAALAAAERAYEHGGVRDPEAVLSAVRERIVGHGAAIAIEYAAAVRWDDLQPAGVLGDGTVIAVAAHLGRTRLIDNVILGRERVAERLGLAPDVMRAGA